MIRFRCSYCDKLLGIDNSEAGKYTRCVRCKKRVQIPAASDVTPGQSKKTAKPGPAGQKEEGLAETDDYEVIEEFEVIEEGDPGEQVDSLEEVEDLDEIELIDEEEEEESRSRRTKRPGKGKVRRRREEEDEEETFFTRNRITGIAGLVVGPAFLVFGIMWQFDNDLDLILRIIIMVLGGLIMLSGLFYVIKG